jgi:hypothetical protein
VDAASHSQPEAGATDSLSPAKPLNMNPVFRSQFSGIVIAKPL